MYYDNLLISKYKIVCIYFGCYFECLWDMVFTFMIRDRDSVLNYPKRLTSDGDSVGRSPQNTDLVQLTVIRYAPRNPKERAAYRTGAPDIPSIQVPAAPYNWNVQNPW